MGLMHWFTSHDIGILAGAALALVLLFALRVLFHKRALYRQDTPWARLLTTIIQAVFWALVILLLLTVGLAMASLLAAKGDETGVTVSAVQDWLLGRGIPALVIVIVTVVVLRLLRISIPHLMRRSVEVRGRTREAREEMGKRAQTLSSMFVSAASIFLVAVATLTVLAQLGVSIAPLLASAGVVGIAVGFGAQALVRDFLSGVFILLEDQYNKGDVVKIAGIMGQVEAVNFRRTVLRDQDGVVHSIPNGAITTTSNYTRELSCVNLNVPVAYDQDLDRALAVIDRVGQELAGDKKFSRLICTTPRALRVDSFGETGIEIKVVGDTRPSAQWEVTGELRRRIKAAFDAEGIRMPKGGAPHRHPAETIPCPVCKAPNLPDASYCSACGRAMGGELGG